jgi:hypothetical protein
MFDLGPRLGFAVLDFELGLIEPAAFFKVVVASTV